MPQFQQHPSWKLEGASPAAVLDVDTAVKDGILGPAALAPLAPAAMAAEKVDLRRMMEELDAAGEEEEGGAAAAAAAAAEGGGVPAVFVCPISLEPMVDPVTLCTGQTYERAHIARWLAMGHLTCPTTMQDLWDGGSLTPNRTLQHLILSWFSARYVRLKKRSADVVGRAQSLLSSLRGKLKSPARAHALLLLRRLAASHPSVRSSLSHPDALSTLSALLGPFTPHAVGAEAVALLSLLCPPLPLPGGVGVVGCGGGSSSSSPLPLLLLAHPQRFSLLVDLLGDGSPDTKLCCARLILSLSRDPAFRPQSAASLGLFVGLLRLVRDHRRHPAGASAALVLIRSLSSAHTPVLSMLVTVGAVPALLDLLLLLLSSDPGNAPALNPNADLNAPAAPGLNPNANADDQLEPALQILDELGSVPEGRTALKECPRTIPCAVRVLMRVSEPCTRSALNVLWAVCKLAPEECAPAAVEAGLAAKLLLVIQSGCAQELKQRAAELLKLCSLNYNATHFISKCKLTRTIQ